MDCSALRSSPVVPPSSSACFPSFHRPCNLRFARFRGVGIGKRLVSRASGADDKDPLNGASSVPLKLFCEEAIGAEYGEGFETFRIDGPLMVDVDYLNDRLQECFLQRTRHAMKPDEAFGLIFSWDNVVADTARAKLDSWKQLAEEEGKDVFFEQHTSKTLRHSAADHVLLKDLCWAKEENELERLKSRLSQLYYDNLDKLTAPLEGLKEWLDALHTAGIPCAVVSCLDRRYMVEYLTKLGLSEYFQAIIAKEDGMESMAHRFLSAAVKVDRKPSRCIVFEDDPRGIAAAHNCTMKAVALIGVLPAYELVQADLAVASFNDLSVINLRRLFAQSGSSFMDLQKQIIEKSPSKRKLMTDTNL